MRILIETKNLIDFPYTPQYEFLFSFDPEKVEALVSEILYAFPTCYLVSGYRGSGKTSFIKRVEQRCKDERAKSKDLKAPLFVHSNFSRFENKTNFLRKVIRDLQETVLSLNEGVLSEARIELERLNRQTFYAVKEEHSRSVERESSTEYSLDLSDFFIKAAKAVSPLLIPALAELLYKLIPDGFLLNNIGWLKTLVYLGSIGVAAFNLLKISRKYTIKRTQSRKDSEELLTDDDIINFYLEKLISKFSDQGYRLVFVLDELDKIDDSELDNLLKEMKPWLVRGKADFIIVAGQRLTMKYYLLRDADDELLASLFSKVIHVNLLSETTLEKIFNDYLFINVELQNGNSLKTLTLSELDQKESMQVRALRNRYMFRCKRLPRAFMNLIRQDLRWEGKVAFLEVPEYRQGHETVLPSILKNIFDKISLNANIPETAKDYMVMYVYRVASSIDIAEVKEILIPEVKSDYTYLVDSLKACIVSLFEQSKQGGLLKIKAPSEEQIESAIQTMRPSALIEKTIKEEKPEEKQPEMDPLEKLLVDQPQPIDLKEMDRFQKDFLAFFKKLYDLSAFFKLADEDSKHGLKSLMNLYQNAGIVSFPALEGPDLDNDWEYFRENNRNLELFSRIRNLFRKVSFSIPELEESIFRKLTEKELKESSYGYFLTSDEMPFAEREFADFKLEQSGSGDFEPDIFFRYQYINGPVSISSDEAHKMVNILDEYNLRNEKGNYLISIVFSSIQDADFTREEENAAKKIREIRKDLAGKIIYIIISNSEFDKLHGRLWDLGKLFVQYGIAPRQEKSVAIQKSRKGVSAGVKAAEFSTVPDDPQKGRWGGKPETENRKLSAKIKRDSDDPQWFYVDLKVEATGESSLKGKVTFYLHDSFNPDKITVMAKNNIAELKELGCHEAFTVGAMCDNGSTKLELDLNTVKNAPKEFKY